VKIAPDLSDDDIKDIADTIVKTKVDGVIIGNTTVSRPKTLQSGRCYINLSTRFIDSNALQGLFKRMSTDFWMNLFLKMKS